MLPGSALKQPPPRSLEIYPRERNDVQPTMDAQLHSFLAGLPVIRGFRRRFSARPFYLVLLSLSLLAAGALVVTAIAGEGAASRTDPLAKRDSSLVLDEEDVHEVSASVQITY